MCHGHSVASKNIHLLSVIMELHLDMEGQVGIDKLSFVTELLLLIELVKRAEPTSLAVFDEALLIWVVTGVNS